MDDHSPDGPAPGGRSPEWQPTPEEVAGIVEEMRPIIARFVHRFREQVRDLARRDDDLESPAA